MEIKLLTYNVQSWDVTERRIKGIIDLIKRYNPDVFTDNKYVSYNGIIMNDSDFGNFNYGVTGAYLFDSDKYPLDTNSILVKGGNLAAFLSSRKNDVYKIYHSYTGGICTSRRIFKGGGASRRCQRKAGFLARFVQSDHTYAFLSARNEFSYGDAGDERNAGIDFERRGSQLCGCDHVLLSIPNVVCGDRFARFRLRLRDGLDNRDHHHNNNEIAVLVFKEMGFLRLRLIWQNVNLSLTAWSLKRRRKKSTGARRSA